MSGLSLVYAHSLPVSNQSNTWIKIFFPSGPPEKLCEISSGSLENLVITG
jgi:hypothetical protein